MEQCDHGSFRHGVGPQDLPCRDGVPVEPSAAERIAEHTGRDEYFLADRIADALAASGRAVQLTSGERALVAQVIRGHRGG